MAYVRGRRVRSRTQQDFLRLQSQQKNSSGLGLVGYDDCLIRSRSRVQFSDVTSTQNKDQMSHGLVVQIGSCHRYGPGSIPMQPRTDPARFSSFE